MQNNIKWIKHIKIGEDTFGIYKPISSLSYTTPVWEDIFHFTFLGNNLVNRTSISGKYGPKKGPYASAYTPEACRNRYENTVKRAVCKCLYKHSNWKEVSEQPILNKLLKNIKKENLSSIINPKMKVMFGISLTHL